MYRISLSNAYKPDVAIYLIDSIMIIRYSQTSETPDLVPAQAAAAL